MQAEGQVRVSRVVLEDPAVCSGPTADPQTGDVVPAHQRLRLRLFAGSFTQTGAAGAQLPQDKLTDTKVEAQNYDVDDVDHQQTGSVVPAGTFDKQFEHYDQFDDIPMHFFQFQLYFVFFCILF